ncbi:MAG: hypothetical protein ACJAQ2_001573 [Vicingaceae bacterium]|jgi:hypothetical protein
MKLFADANNPCLVFLEVDNKNLPWVLDFSTKRKQIDSLDTVSCLEYLKRCTELVEVVINS